MLSADAPAAAEESLAIVIRNSSISCAWSSDSLLAVRRSCSISPAVLGLEVRSEPDDGDVGERGRGTADGSSTSKSMDSDAEGVDGVRGGNWPIKRGSESTVGGVEWGKVSLVVLWDSVRWE